MYPYRKPQFDIFIDLVKQANPGLALPFTAATVSLGTPVAQAVPQGGIADTNVRVRAKPGALYVGSKVVQYRRIDLTAFFKNQTLEVTSWSSGSTQTVAQIIEALNAQYGISLLVSDTVHAGVPNTGNEAVGYDGQWGIALYSGSLCYTLSEGARVITLRRGKRPVSDAFASGNLSGRAYAGGNSFPGGRKPQGQYMSYDIDFSTSLTGTAGSGTVGTTWAGIFDILKTNVDSRFSHTTTSDVFGGCSGLSYTVYPLPNAAVPEANSAKFAKVLAIFPVASSWFQGPLLMHFN